MPFHKTDELDLHYQHLLPESSSKNHPVLLLAGMASDSASWQPVIDALKADYELIVPDNRCTGRTMPNPIQTSRELMIQDTVALLDKLDIKKVNIIGHSMGGMLGWAIAASEPDRVNNLVVASALPSVSRARIELFKSLSALRSESNEAEWFKLLYQFLFVPALFDNDAALNAMVLASQQYTYKQNTESFAQQVAGLDTFLDAPDISKVICPVTIMTGSHDVLATPLMFEQFKSDNDSIDMHIIENAAHALHWEQTEQVVRYLVNVLKEG